MIREAIRSNQKQPDGHHLRGKPPLDDGAELGDLADVVGVGVAAHVMVDLAPQLEANLGTSAVGSDQSAVGRHDTRASAVPITRALSETTQPGKFTSNQEPGEAIRSSPNG